MSKVYIKTDDEFRIIAITSSDFLSDSIGWIEIDEGEGDRYTHAQGNYFPKTLITEDGAYRYKLVNGIPVERTAEEITADIQPTATAEPTLEERIEALEAATLEIIMGGITE